MRFLLAVLSVLLFLAILGAQDPALTLSGDVKEVEREKLVVVKERVKVVDLAKPLVIEAPKGGVHYVWILPPNVTSTKKANSIEIAAAPRGPLKISVSWIVIDFAKMTSTDGSASVEFHVGGFDPPVPTEPLAKELHGLFTADTGIDKAANVVKLAAVFRQAEKLAAQKSGDIYAVVSAGQLAEAVRAVSRLLLPADALPSLRKRAGEFVGECMADFDPDLPLTDETRAKAVACYGKLATALETLK